MEARAEVAISKMGADEAVCGFATLLHELRDADEEAPNHEESPGAALRFVYDHWVERGGYERGKPRHSARQIKAWLGDDQVRSLETKLAGKTWLPYQDAFSLLRLMLSRWTYNKLGDSYEPYVIEPELDNTIRSFLQDLFPSDQKALLLPERGRKADSARPRESTGEAAVSSAREFARPAGEVIRELFSESDALMTIGRARTVLGSDPAESMTAFHNLMSSLFGIAQETKRNQILLWVVDLGLRNDKAAAHGAIYNIYFLIAQFRAIALIERDGREEFYEWLRQNVIVIVGSLTVSEVDRIYRQANVELPDRESDISWFQGDRLFVESIPHRWLDVEGSGAFGKTQAELWASPTITAHFRFDEWDLDHSSELDRRKSLRYMFHSLVTAGDSERALGGVRCIPLPEPGSRWSDGYRLALQAAFERLGRDDDERLGQAKPSEALLLLRKDSFAVLRLDEFLHLVDMLIDQGNNFETKDHQ